MKKLIFALLIFAFLISPSSAATFEPLTDFVTLVDFPTDMKSGVTYQSNFSFSSTHNTSIIVNFSMIHPDINSGEWIAYFILNDTSMSFNESSPGNFTSNATPIAVGDHNLTVSFRSLPNIVPGNYNYTFNLSSEQIEILPGATKKKSSGKSSSSWAIVTPTPTATPTPTLTPTPAPTAVATVIPSAVTTATPVSTPVANETKVIKTNQLTDYRPHMILGGMLLLILAIIILILLGSRRRKAVRNLKK